MKHATRRPSVLSIAFLAGRLLLPVGALLAAVGASAFHPICPQGAALPTSEYFTVDLPLVGLPPHDPGENWPRPSVWHYYPNATADSIEVPNGRPIYALFVSGFGNNGHMDELMCYKFALNLMAQGAYVHYAWWNNLLAPYMERPLHHPQSYPGDVDVDGTPTSQYYKFDSLADAHKKAGPGEDYQFVADAKRFLAAIRQHNPSAMIIVIGHSMGGSSVVHLGSPWTTPGDPEMPYIDILAPLDPGNNRNFPFGGSPFRTQIPPQPGPNHPTNYLNGSRWRGTRENFRGFKARNFFCNTPGEWQYDIELAPWGLCPGGPFYDETASPVRFTNKIINLYHVWQTEYLPQWDYETAPLFGRTGPLPIDGSTDQHEIATSAFGTDPGGWPIAVVDECCPTGTGSAWGTDGHGEIVGWRGPFIPIPLGVRVRTSPECGASCFGVTWPARTSTLNAGVFTWSDSQANKDERVALLKALEQNPTVPWLHRPTNPDLCLVSGELHLLFNNMNRPPRANAGRSRTVQSNPQGVAVVTLDGSRSSDPDQDALTYGWTWPLGSATGVSPSVTLPAGNHGFLLTVTDPSGHMDRDRVLVKVQ